MNARITPEQILQHYGQQAREDMIERLMDGKQVGHVDITDLLDHDLDQGILTTKELAATLLNVIAYAKDEHTHVERRSKIEQRMRSMVERWVESHPDQVQIRAEEIAEAEAEDARADEEAVTE